MTPRPRLVIVLPEMKVDSPTHYAHYFALVREIAHYAELAVVVERGGAPAIDGVETIGIRNERPLGRALELAWLMLRLRRRGFRTAYGSYSAYFGIVVGVLGRLVGVRTAFWHCRSDFFDRAISRRMTFATFLRHTVPLVMSLYFSRMLVTGTPGLADLYRRTFRLPARKVRVVPNEIDLRYWHPADTTDRSTSASARGEGGPTLLFVHRLSEHKGARMLGPIFRGLRHQFPRVKLIVAGDGPDAPRLRAELAGAVRAGDVTLLGYVSNSQVRSLMTSTDVLLVPSLEEGFPRVILEAMSCGLPVIANNVGGIGEIVGPRTRDLLAQPGDVAGFARATARVLADDELKNAMRSEGLERVRRYDVTVVARQLVDAVCEVQPRAHRSA